MIFGCKMKLKRHPLENAFLCGAFRCSKVLISQNFFSRRDAETQFVSHLLPCSSRYKRRGFGGIFAALRLAPSSAIRGGETPLAR